MEALIPGQLVYRAYQRVSPPGTVCNWEKLDFDSVTFWLRLELAIQHDQVARRLDSEKAEKESLYVDLPTIDRRTLP